MQMSPENFVIKTLRIVLLLFCLPGFGAQANETKDEISIAVLGDSLSAGYRLGPKKGFTDQLEKALRDNLRDKGHKIIIHNAAVSGDTTSGALSRMEWSLADSAGKMPDGVIIELGGNDALRGIAPEITHKNLEAMITRLKTSKVEVMLAGMLAPPNMGKAYEDAFNPIFPQLAKKHDLIFYPFFLDGVAAEAALNLDDGMHPNEDGVALIVQKILPSVEDLIARILAAREAKAN